MLFCLNNCTGALRLSILMIHKELSFTNTPVYDKSIARHIIVTAKSFNIGNAKAQAKLGAYEKQKILFPKKFPLFHHASQKNVVKAYLRIASPSIFHRK